LCQHVGFTNLRHVFIFSPLEGTQSLLVELPLASFTIEKLLQGFMGVSKNRGTPKWMVKIMENPIKMDDLEGSLFLETPLSTNSIKVAGPAFS